MGVELRMGLRVTDVDFNGIDVKTAGRHRAHRRGHRDLGRRRGRITAGEDAGDASGAEVDRAGRVACCPTARCPVIPRSSPIGDMMSLDHLPGVAEVAMQQGLSPAHDPPPAARRR